jgi:hypothetical protein
MSNSVEDYIFGDFENWGGCVVAKTNDQLLLFVAWSND